MELKEFVKNTLVQIVDGVIEAERELDQKGATVNPVGGYFDQKQVGGRTWSFEDGIAEVVDFDVALTSSEKEGTTAGIGVLLGSINLGAKGMSEEALSSVTRIKFSVPVLLPKGKTLVRG
ncbi:hypothetical protein [Microbulbifer hainanensis]|uniref:hypothetical protein n=1 Tax=Microbulbifer hainanensis TaxID=2735675 RepID=UPI0018696104|nr:hypothetical protein [Microbulbifer hainanensis]